MFRRTPERKRKRVIKRIIMIGIIGVVLLGILGGMGYYLIALQLHKPLYVSPLSKTTGKQSAPLAVDEDDSVAVIKKTLKEKQIEFDAVMASGSAYIVDLKAGGKVIFSSEKPLMSQVSSLQFILSRLTMEGRQIRRLDLRFDKPIAVFGE